MHPYEGSQAKATNAVEMNSNRASIIKVFNVYGNCLQFKLLLCVSVCISLVTAQSCLTPSYEEGRCVDYKYCQTLNNWINQFGNNIPKYLLDYLYSSRCSQDNEPVRICCRIEHVIQRHGAVSNVVDTDYNRDYISQLDERGVQILKELNCGNSNGNRIAGGNETNLNEFPWMALLEYSNSGEPFKCGGSLITNEFVLTAAHCVHGFPKEIIEVRLGEHDISTIEDCQRKGNRVICAPPIEKFGISEIMEHPHYSAGKIINDIALLRLDRKVQFKKHIQPICLPHTLHSMNIALDDDFVISGWGVTEKGYRSNVLLKANIKVSNRAFCEETFRIEINLKHICAGDLYSGRDTCKGDSGGPFFQLAPYTTNKRYIQYGIVSFGPVNCDLSYKLPGVYTNLITYMPWITNKII